MSALGWALSHPVNRRSRPQTAARWALHQVRKRLKPTGTSVVKVGPAVLAGPNPHPVICLARYTRGGLVDLDAFLVYSALLHDGDHFVDVGANLGLHSVVAGRLVGARGTFVAAEPDPEQRSWLERNMALNGLRAGIVARPLADRTRSVAWRREGEITSHLAIDETGESLVTTTLDEVVARHGLNPGRLFVKVDVEGWEPAVVVGGRRTLAAGVKGLWLEANGLQHHCDIPWHHVVELLHRWGYLFWVVRAGTQTLQRVADPPPVSPTLDYLVASERAARPVAEALNNWNETAEQLTRAA